MKSYPLNSSIFANTSVTSSFAISGSFIQNLVPTVIHTLFPQGPQGEPGTSGGKVYLLSSSLRVCSGTPAPTTTTTTTSTTTTSTTTTTTAAPVSTTTTTTTTTAALLCFGVCETGTECPKGCVCGPLNKCISPPPS